jgi:FkbM family methyltransferase
MTNLLSAAMRRARQMGRRVLKYQRRPYATLRVNGYSMTLDMRDPVISSTLLKTRSWEPYETRLMSQVLEPGDTFIDIGAHIGYYSLLAAQRVGPRGRVLAFEPAPDNYALLKRNVAQNRLTRIIHTENCALASQPGELTLHLSAHNNGDHRVYATDRADDKIFNNSRRRRQVRVPAISLDAFLPEKFPGIIDVIKMDVQGAEMSALQGMQRILEQNPDIVLFMEYWPHGLRQCGGDPARLLEMVTDQAGLSLLFIDPEAEQVTPIAASELVANDYDPTVQVDLIATRAPVSTLAQLQRQTTGG